MTSLVVDYRTHPLSVAEIKEAVLIRSDVIEGTIARKRLHGIINRYVGTAVLTNSKVMRKMQNEILRTFAAEIIPFAQEAGRISAAPILGTKGIKAARLRGPALAELHQATRGDLLVLRANIRAAGTELVAEMDVAFAGGVRSGASRRSIIDMAKAASKAELKSLTQATEALDVAAGRLSKATTTKARKEAQSAVQKAKRSLAGRKTFLARFETKVQGTARDTIRREVYSAQEAQFRQAGFGARTEYTWLAVGSGSCPDCISLHGTTRKLSAWNGQKPGDGQTVCGASCRCELTPNTFVAGNPGLTAPIIM